jgi:hypothetical protein
LTRPFGQTLYSAYEPRARRPHPHRSFAAASLLSQKALRLYAQLGILAPRYVDPDSGYRY